MSEPTLPDFLLARIAEDEAVARTATTIGVPRVEHLGGGKWGKEYVKQMELGGDVTRGVVWSIAPGQSSPGSTGTDKTGTALFERFDPARVLAECESKRRIVERYLDVKAYVDRGNYDDEYAAELSGLETALEFLTAPYADHPDWREEWRPEVVHEQRDGVCVGCEQAGEPVEWLLAEARGHSDERQERP